MLDIFCNPHARSVGYSSQQEDEKQLASDDEQAGHENEFEVLDMFCDPHAGFLELS